MTTAEQARIDLTQAITRDRVAPEEVQTLYQMKQVPSQAYVVRVRGEIVGHVWHFGRWYANDIPGTHASPGHAARVLAFKHKWHSTLP